MDLKKQRLSDLKMDTIERLPFHFSLARIGEGNGNPLQCSCLENPRDGGAWWAAIYGVAQSRTQLKRLSSSSSSSRLKEQIYGFWGEGCGEGIVRGFGMDLYRVLCLKWIANEGLLCNMEFCSMLWWEGSLRENGYMYMYGWVSSLFAWNYHNDVNWL